MKLIKLAPATILLAGFLSQALADEYQDTISKAFPGYRILRPSDIKLDKDEMNQEIYNQVKDHPGLVVGKINSDDITDFAALIRGSTITHIAENRARGVIGIDFYEGYLVVCLGRAKGKYDCRKMNESPMRITVPHDVFLAKMSPREQDCLVSGKFRPPKPAPDPNLGFDPKAEPSTGSVRISFATDAIGLFQTLGPGDIVYIYQPKGMYLECIISD